ncbi:hypothetical protein [Streptomyces sp. Inha503]|uniref:hypothetical protein n=1 Tax=Streptomyces sp. Inha503 TaxID=3383314 RepID=UPI0039A21464
MTAEALAQATAAANALQARLTSPDAYALRGELHVIAATCLTQDRKRSGKTRAEEAAAISSRPPTLPY